MEVKIGFNYFSPKNINKLFLPIYPSQRKGKKYADQSWIPAEGVTAVSLAVLWDLEYIFDVVDLIPRLHPSLTS